MSDETNSDSHSHGRPPPADRRGPGQRTPTIDWYVIDGGGGHAEAGIYGLDGTIGQPVVGTATGTGSELWSGFWCGGAVEYKIYLPLVLRNFS